MTKKREILIFIAILAIAAFFRLYKLDSAPPGLYPDEAMNGNNALTALSGEDEFKVFYPENNGREGLFINIQALSLKIFGIHPWSLRLVSAIFGILTVAGLYLLTKLLFGWKPASLAAFLMAITSWHVIFSRIGFRAIMLPFVLVFGFYFFFKGIKKGDLVSFSLSGLFWGLGAHTYISYRVAPLILLIIMAVYWLSLKKDFSFSKYDFAKTRLFMGFIILAASAVFIALPVLIFYFQNPDAFLSRAGAYLSVFSQKDPPKELFSSIFKTLGMFNFQGDWNWRHNISGWPQLSLPIGALFILGFIRELLHLARIKHGHVSTNHTLLFAWFFVMLLPGFLSIEAPHALRAIGVIPVVMIFSGLGAYWIFEKLYKWYSAFQPELNPRKPRILVTIALTGFLISLGILEYNRYFIIWAQDPETHMAFNQNYVDMAERINNLPPDSRKRYILVNTGGTLVNGIPMPSQTVMFLTDTYTAKKQVAKNLFYLTEDQFKKGDFEKNSIIIPLED